jgi:hypothetical protein
MNNGMIVLLFVSVLAVFMVLMLLVGAFWPTEDNIEAEPEEIKELACPPMLGLAKQVEYGLYNASSDDQDAALKLAENLRKDMEADVGYPRSMGLGEWLPVPKVKKKKSKKSSKKAKKKSKKTK